MSSRCARVGAGPRLTLQTYVQESHEVEEFGRAGTGHARKPARKQRKTGKDKAKIKKVQRASCSGVDHAELGSLRGR